MNRSKYIDYFENNSGFFKGFVLNNIYYNS